ncbi:hypothetical protein Agub_g5829, partial [Astrephomene gubernaculifera]
MQPDSSVVLFEELQLYGASSGERALAVSSVHKRQAADSSDRGGLLVSPDGSAVAILDATATSLTLLHFSDQLSPADVNSPRKRQDLTPCTAVRTFQPTRIDKCNLSLPDAICAVCWSEDGIRLALACLSGHVYILDRSGKPLAMLPPTGTPWAGKRPGAVALPSPSLLLLLTARPPLIFAVPLGPSGGAPAAPSGSRPGPPAAAPSSAVVLPPPRVLAALRPQPLGKAHGVVRTAVYDARTALLVVAGEGGCCGRGGAAGAGGSSQRGSGGTAAAADVSVSAWRLEVSAGGSAVKAAMLGAYVGPVASAASASPSASPAWPRRRWMLSLSPLGEHVALHAVPKPAGSKAGGGGGGGGGVLVLSLPQCLPVDPAAQFAGRSAGPPLPPATSGAPKASLAGSAVAAASVAWWSDETRLALSDVYGRVGLASLPGYDSLLSPWDEQPKFTPGTLIATKTNGPGPRGILVLEPTPTTSPTTTTPNLPQQQRQQQLPSKSSLLASSPAPPPAPGMRLVFLAERTP